MAKAQVNFDSLGGGEYKVYKTIKYHSGGALSVSGVGFEPKEIYIGTPSQILTNIDVDENVGNTLYEIVIPGLYSGNSFGTLSVNSDGFSDNFSFSAMNMSIICIG